jgi:hypothetical protein
VFDVFLVALGSLLGSSVGLAELQPCHSKNYDLFKKIREIESSISPFVVLGLVSVLKK